MNPKLLASLTPSSLRDRANTRREREREMEEQNWENAHERESELARSEGKKVQRSPCFHQFDAFATCCYIRQLPLFEPSCCFMSPRVYIRLVALFSLDIQGRVPRVLERRRLVRRQTMEYVSLLSAGALSCSAVASNLMHIHREYVYRVDIGIAHTKQYTVRSTPCRPSACVRANGEPAHVFHPRTYAYRQLNSETIGVPRREP